MPALDKKQLRKDIAREEKKKRRETIAKLKARFREARKRKGDALATAGAQCRAGRERAATARAAAREAIAKARAAREAAKGSCGVPAGVHALQAAVEVARAELRAEEEAARELRAIDRMASRRKKGPDLASAGPKRETDEQVIANLPPELHGLFRRVARSIKGSPRASRTEAFLEYVEAHPDEVWGGIEDETDRMIAEHEQRLRRGNPKMPTNAAVKEYIRSHWGERGDFRMTTSTCVTTGGGAHGALVVLGRFERIVYSTRKGGEDGGKLTDYEHEFCEGERLPNGEPKPGKSLPFVAYHKCERGKACPEDGKLVICGGTYRTEPRGIVG